ncbi:FadR/GntR family transcriptional regulator [Chelatococcus asaccharovorans]|uniref:FadR/GntR family transcriptional regulator n=1 Tax=Chelatococcus asaccharovorans TaxID=28210 RepID=UPI00224C7147|nr:FadR/GntR family transcriptional regulator [Chelatococcus asaccharovorans]CAH1651124.1 GntR family transcriptional regulator [Chelatococcus asaccharovorans]CAH1692743.1 GntR family transcriptional regulator [Chelatococcus asaccharovorans]
MTNPATKTTPALSIVRNKRVYEQIAEQIGDMIRSEQYRAGDRIPPERDLAKLLGVSRPSVREAMIALEAAGLIEVRVGDGTYVREAAATTGVMPWSAGADPGPGPLEQFQARRLIETEMAARAAVSATAGEIQELEALVDEMARVYPTLDDFDDKLGFRFHTALARAARNGVLANVVEYLWTLRDSDMWRHLRRRVVTPDNRRQVVIDRREIVAGIAERNPARAKAAMIALLDRAERRYFGPDDEELK